MRVEFEAREKPPSDSKQLESEWDFLSCDGHNKKNFDLLPALRPHCIDAWNLNIMRQIFVFSHKGKYVLYLYHKTLYICIRLSLFNSMV